MAILIDANQIAISHLMVRGQITMQRVGFGRAYPQILIAYKLSPAKTKRAIRMARLALAWEEQ